MAPRSISLAILLRGVLSLCALGARPERVALRPPATETISRGRLSRGWRSGSCAAAGAPRAIALAILLRGVLSLCALGARPERGALRPPATEAVRMGLALSRLDMQQRTAAGAPR